MKATMFILILLMMLMIAGCGAPAELPKLDTEPAATAALSPVPDTDKALVEAASSAEDLRGLISRFTDEGNNKAKYLAAMKLIELDPSATDAYLDASTALYLMSEENMMEINRLLALGLEDAQNSEQLVEWAQRHQPDFAINIPFASDYASDSEINTTGITTGNLSNAGKYGGVWHGGLLTWQGNWVYLSYPGEDFAVYKVRADGTGRVRVGDIRGSSLNVMDDWLYYISAEDSKPWRARTDGSKAERLVEDICSFLSVEGGFMYYDNGSDNGCLYRNSFGCGGELKLSDMTAMLPCVAEGWVYYCPKAEDGGLWRVPAEGGSAQQLAKGFIQCYAVTGGWIYYLDGGDTRTVRRVRTDGTGDEAFVSSDNDITTLNAADGRLVIAFTKTYEEDGFIISGGLAAYDLATKQQLFSRECATEPVCLGRGGRTYLFSFGENMKWFSFETDGAFRDLG